MKILMLIPLFSLALEAQAASITKNYTYSSGTVASAAEINSNFDQLVTAVNSLDTRVTTLEGGSAGATNIDGLSDGKTTGATDVLFLGTGAGDANTGNENVGLGNQALQNNVTGTGNMAIGKSAMRFHSGNDNLAIGTNAMQNAGTTSENVAIGIHAQSNNNTGGDRNVAIGFSSLRDNTTGVDNVAIGRSALYGAGAISHNIGIGNYSGESLNGGSANILVGHRAGDNLTTGSNNIVIGYNIDAPAVGSTNTMTIGNLIYAIGVDGSGTGVSSGSVGIGDSSPSFRLDVNGTIRGFTITDSSDLRLKRDIRPLEGDLEKLQKLRGVTFRWSEREREQDPQIGFIAQEVERVYPELVETAHDGIKSVNYSHLVAPLTEAVKTLAAENERLREEMKAVKAYLCAKEPGSSPCR
jgi:hypothetical protein